MMLSSAPLDRPHGKPTASQLLGRQHPQVLQDLSLSMEFRKEARTDLPVPCSSGWARDPDLSLRVVHTGSNTQGSGSLKDPVRCQAQLRQQCRPLQQLCCKKSRLQCHDPYVGLPNYCQNHCTHASHPGKGGMQKAAKLSHLMFARLSAPKDADSDIF